MFFTFDLNIEQRIVLMYKNKMFIFLFQMNNFKILIDLCIDISSW